MTKVKRVTAMAVFEWPEDSIDAWDDDERIEILTRELVWDYYPMSIDIEVLEDDPLHSSGE